MITTEAFNTITYSNESLFVKEDGKISLKRYRDDLLFYSSFDGTVNATYSTGNGTPTSSGSNATENFGVFAQNVNLQGSLKYSADNFELLKNEGSIQFRMKPIFNNGVCSQTSLSTFSTISNQDYSFELYINGTIEDTYVVPLTTGMTIGQILGAIDTELTGSTVEVINATGDKLKFYSTIPGDYIEVMDAGNSLLTLFGGMDDPIIPNGPSSDVTLLALTNETNNNNKLELIHTTTSNLFVKIYNKNGVLVVNKDFGVFSNSIYYYYAFEIAWSSNLLFLYIDGKMFGVTNFDDLDRDTITTKLVLTGSASNAYRIDELIVYNTTQNFKSYTVSSAALTPYTTTNPYIDIEFGTGFKETEVKDLNLTCSNNLSFVVKIGSTWYYYLAGSWRISNGTYAQSTGAGTLESRFGELFFNEEAPLTFRAYFYSSGNDEAYLDNISIIMERGDEQPAVVIGSIDLSSPVNLVTSNKITITTGAGSAVVNVATGAGNAAAVTLSEIKAAIDAATVPGLGPAKDDGYGHLVLETTATGSEAFVSVSEGSTEDALDIVWGFEATDTGEEADTSVNIDYAPLYDYVRTSLGAPIVPVELTDGQLAVCLQEAVYEFNRWKNFKENLYYTTLSGNARDGYEIPAIIGGSDNIIDVIIKPRLPFGYFSTSADAAANIYVQYFFNKYGKPGANGFLTDYSLMISFQKDMGLILGTEPRWYILNNKLFLQPRPSDSLAIGIKYRASLSIDEVINSMLIKRYVVAKAKLLLGNIRGTFGGSIPGGAENIQLNAAEMISQGNAELEAVKNEMKGQAEPLMFEFG